VDQNLVTRRFIVLTRKLRDDVRNALPLLRTEIEKICRRIEANTAEHHAANEKEPTPQVVTALLSRSQSEIDKEETNAAHQEKRATRHERRDIRRLQIETLALGLGAILAAATIGQWIVTKQAVRIAAKSADAAQRGAAASETQVKATQESIHATVNAFQVDQRAWVNISDVIPPTLQAKTPLLVVIDIRNTGKTPAKLAQYRGIGEIQPKGILPKQSDQPIRGTVIIPPNGLFHVTLGNFQTHPSDDDLKAISSGDKVIWIHGAITYADVFKQTHSTKFCYYFLPQERTVEHGAGGFALCETGNDAD
jgi:hypothetical protein